MLIRNIFKNLDTKILAYLFNPPDFVCKNLDGTTRICTEDEGGCDD